MKFLSLSDDIFRVLFIVSVLLFVLYKIMYLSKLYYCSLVVCRVLVCRTLS